MERQLGETESDLEVARSDYESETQKRMELDSELTHSTRNFTVQLTEQSVRMDQLQENFKRKE